MCINPFCFLKTKTLFILCMQTTTSSISVSPASHLCKGELTTAQVSVLQCCMMDCKKRGTAQWQPKQSKEICPPGNPMSDTQIRASGKATRERGDTGARRAQAPPQPENSPPGAPRGPSTNTIKEPPHPTTDEQPTTTCEF